MIRRSTITATIPAELYVKAGAKAANRGALAKWGAWVNAYTAKKYGRPLVLAASADLAGSTNLKGFADAFGNFPGYGWYERAGTPDGVLLPAEITEFSNAAIVAAATTVNFATDPEKQFEGFWGACIHLRLLLLPEVWSAAPVQPVCAGLGPSDGEVHLDSRTHRTRDGGRQPYPLRNLLARRYQLFPAGSIINLYPWEHNEVPVLLGAALRRIARSSRFISPGPRSRFPTAAHSGSLHILKPPAVRTFFANTTKHASRAER